MRRRGEEKRYRQSALSTENRTLVAPSEAEDVDSRKLIRASRRYEMSFLSEVQLGDKFGPFFVFQEAQMRGVWSTHLIGRTHFHDAQTRRRTQNPPLQKSSAIPALSVAFKTTFEVSTRAGPDNSLERFTERSVGLVTDRPSDVYELLVTLL
jgi:hypothetical protein